MRRLAALFLAAWGIGAFGATFPDWAADAAARGGGWEPNAPTIVLTDDVRIEFSATDRFVEREQRAVAVRRDAGAANARLALYYNPDTDRIRSIRAWVRSADGHVTGFDQSAFDDQVLHYNQYYWDRQRIRVFNRGDILQAGAVAAYEVVIERNPGFAESGANFAIALPAWSQSFEAIPAPGSQLAWFADGDALQHPVTGSAPGGLRWAAGPRRGRGLDVPAGYQPISQRVTVRCGPLAPLTWPALSHAAYAVMKPQMELTPEIAQLAHSLSANRTDRWSRLRAVTEWVQTQIVYLAISLDRDNLAGCRPHLTPDVLRNRYGDCKDKATLLVEMLRALGEDPRLVLVAAEDPEAVDEHWPEISFNHVIVAIPSADIPSGWPSVRLQNRTYVLFDPTSSGTPLGVLPLGDENGWGLLLDEHQGDLVRLPRFSDSAGRMTRTIDARLDAHRLLNVHLTQENFGIAGAHFYEATRLQSAEQFQRGQEEIVARFESAARDFTTSHEWSAPDARMRMNLAFAVPSYGQRISPGMILVSPAIMPLVPGLREWGANVKGKAVLAPVSDHIVERMLLPDGASVEDLPDPWTESAAGTTASVTFKSEPHSLDCEVQFQRPARDYNRKDYEAIRRLCAHLDEQQRKPVLLDFPSSP